MVEIERGEEWNLDEEVWVAVWTKMRDQYSEVNAILKRYDGCGIDVDGGKD